MEARGELRVGFVGAGRMAQGVARGAVRAGKVKAANILASAPSDRNLGAFQDLGCRTTHCNSEALQQLLPAGTKVLRVMPNLPCMVQEGAVVFARGSCAGEQEAALLKSLLSACGLCEETPESYIDIHTGVSGSGVAYVYLFAEALAEGAVKMGMPSALANKIAAQTLLVSLDFSLSLQIPLLNHPLIVPYSRPAPSTSPQCTFLLTCSSPIYSSPGFPNAACSTLCYCPYGKCPEKALSLRENSCITLPCGSICLSSNSLTVAVLSHLGSYLLSFSDGLCHLSCAVISQVC
ncbi:unnamed protein product [Caretta caretta]